MGDGHRQRRRPRPLRSLLFLLLVSSLFCFDVPPSIPAVVVEDYSRACSSTSTSSLAVSTGVIVGHNQIANPGGRMFHLALSPRCERLDFTLTSSETCSSLLSAVPTSLYLLGISGSTEIYSRLSSSGLLEHYFLSREARYCSVSASSGHGDLVLVVLTHLIPTQHKTSSLLITGVTVRSHFYHPTVQIYLSKLGIFTAITDTRSKSNLIMVLLQDRRRGSAFIVLCSSLLPDDIKPQSLLSESDAFISTSSLCRSRAKVSKHTLDTYCLSDLHGVCFCCSVSFGLQVFTFLRQLPTVPPLTNSWSHIITSGGCGIISSNPSLRSNILMGFPGPYCFMCYGLLKVVCEIDGLNFNILIQFSLANPAHLLLWDYGFLDILTSLPNDHFSIRESSYLSPPLQRANFPDRDLLEHRSYSLLENFQVAFKSVLFRLLKATSSWSTFGICSIICIAYLDPIEELYVSMSSEELSFYFSLSIVIRIAFYPFTLWFEYTMKVNRRIV